MAFYQALEWHGGEKQLHEALRVPDRDNPVVPMLSGQASTMLQRCPLIAVATLDSEQRPWTTVWGGKKGLSQPLGQSIIGVRTPVAPRHDPVVEILVGTATGGEVVKEQGSGRMVAALPIDLETRKRVKIYGRMIAGALGSSHDEDEENSSQSLKSQGQIQLVMKVEQSLGNCPKYLNKKRIEAANTQPKLVSDSLPLCTEAVELLGRSDLFFIGSSQSTHDMDVNHRGGPPGLVRILSNNAECTVLVYPEYSGNRMYQTLGNLAVTPRAGLCFPNFETGDCLYVTGEAEILIGIDAAEVLPQSNLAVRFTVTAARFVASVLPFRGTPYEFSPYYPAVRYLASERALAVSSGDANQPSNTAKLLRQFPLTPDISRFQFSLSNPATYTAGQYVTLDFSSHLHLGYVHMQDDDPRSLNDDYVRTFTVSSPPGLPAQPSKRLADDEFEITIRRVGVVTGFLFKHGLRRDGRDDLEVEVKGFGGSFIVDQRHEREKIAFVAAGVGITPLLPCLPHLDLTKIDLLWSMRVEDAGLAVSILEEYPNLVASMTLYISSRPSGDINALEEIDVLKSKGATIIDRRVSSEDLKKLDDIARWYLCTGTQQRKLLLQWLDGKKTIFEDYNF